MRLITSGLGVYDNVGIESRRIQINYCSSIRGRSFLILLLNPLGYCQKRLSKITGLNRRNQYIDGPIVFNIFLAHRPDLHERSRIDIWTHLNAYALFVIVNAIESPEARPKPAKST